MTARPLPVEGIPDAIRTAIVRVQLNTANAMSDVSWSEESQLLRVHYSGDSSAQQAAKTEAETAFPSGSRVLVSDSFDHRRLAIEAVRAVELLRASGIDVASVFPKADNTGLDVAIVPGELSLDRVRQILRRLDVPSIVRKVRSKPPFAGGRLNDNAPFYGGNRIVGKSGSAVGSSCTGGFTVHNGSADAFMTVDHCGDPGDVWTAGSGGNTVGTMRDGNSGGSDFIKPTGQDYGATVWLGEISSTTMQAVKGSCNAAKGD